MARIAGEFWAARQFFHQAAFIKASMEYVGLYGGPVRPPFREMTAGEKRELWALMERMGVRKNGELTLEYDLKSLLSAYQAA